MTSDENSQLAAEDDEYLRKVVHDLNNCVGVILASSELLQMGELEDKARKRCGLIEAKSLESREILSRLAQRYFD